TAPAAQTTTTRSDSMLRPYEIIYPDSATVTTEYHLTGEIKRRYGSRIYPVGYGYDYAGRQKYMTNWSSFASQSGPRITTWNYDPYRGWLTNKVYAGNIAGPSYAYTPAGRPKTRTWARGIVTSYYYNNSGQNTNVVYSDGTTPNVTNSFDRLGRGLQLSTSN